jgi:hypothetical protein
MQIYECQKTSENEGENLNDFGAFWWVSLTVRKLLFSDMDSIMEELTPRVGSRQPGTETVGGGIGQ